MQAKTADLISKLNILIQTASKRNMIRQPAEAAKISKQGKYVKTVGVPEGCS